MRLYSHTHRNILPRYMMNFEKPAATGAGGVLVLGAGEDLTCTNCALVTSNYSFAKYRDTTADCSYSFYSITIVDFTVNDIPLNLSPIFAPSNSFPFNYLGKAYVSNTFPTVIKCNTLVRYSAGFAAGCPGVDGQAYPNILDSGTSQILLPGAALKAIGAAICNAYTGPEENCVGMITGDNYWFKTLDGLPDVSILLWDADSASVVPLLLPPIACVFPADTCC